MSNSNSLKQLVEMGFEEARAKKALQETSGNMEQAANYLLTGGGDNVGRGTAAAAAASSFSNEAPASQNNKKKAKIDRSVTITGPISQYSMDEGRSACTCIALTAATKFLTNPSISTDFLQSMITEGVANYKVLSSSSPVEHLSAEEVISKDQGRQFPLRNNHGIRQGLLSHDPDHFIGLSTVLNGIRGEQADGDSWMAVLMTKTPETVLICFPPKSDTATESSKDVNKFWLIDSHPRPQFDAANAYAKQHASIVDLVRSLQVIFPPTDLGPDVPEMMASMYNSFDLYPFSLAK